MSGLRIFSVEGNIGSGKSTLLKYLTEQLTIEGEKIIFLQEPVDAWSKISDEKGATMLEKFYKNQKRYGFSFQMMAYISRLALLKQHVEEHPNAIIITERSLYTDRYVFAKMLFDSNNIELAEYKIYLTWFDTFAKDFPIHKIIYVKTDPPTCQYRIVLRSRTGENQIALAYLNKCNKYHDDMIENNYQRDQVLVLDGNEDFFEKKTSWLASIKKFMLTQ